MPLTNIYPHITFSFNGVSGYIPLISIPEVPLLVILLYVDCSNTPIHPESLTFRGSFPFVGSHILIGIKEEKSLTTHTFPSFPPQNTYPRTLVFANSDSSDKPPHKLLCCHGAILSLFNGLPLNATKNALAIGAERHVLPYVWSTSLKYP